MSLLQAHFGATATGKLPLSFYLRVGVFCKNISESFHGTNFKSGGRRVQVSA